LNKNFDFSPKISILSKNFDFEQKFRLRAKISILSKNFDFEHKFRFFNKNFDFCPKITLKFEGSIEFILLLLFSPMPGVDSGAIRTIFHQDASIHLKFMKHSETKVTKVKVIIITDAILICKRKKDQKSSYLIRPPIRTDRITPVMQDRV